MAQASAAEPALASQILFELDSFKLTSDDRLEISGRWFGVRGRRFVRPTLTLLGDDERSRSLADLEHKPWSPTDGESWVAAFPFDPAGGAVQKVELAVAPDIAVSLPTPEPLRKRRSGSNGARRSRRPHVDGAAAIRAVQTRAPQTEHAGAKKDTPKRQIEALRTQLERERREVARLRDELEKSGATKAELSAALAKRDAAISKFEAIVGERDEAVVERDAAVLERDEARRERDGALHERATMVRTLGRLRAQLEQSVSARNAAYARIDELRASTSDQLEETRKAWNAQVAQLRRTIEEDRAANERALQERVRPEEAARQDRVAHEEPVIPVAPAPPPRLGPVTQAAAAAARSRWLTRSLALLVLLIAVAAVLLIVHSP